MPIFDKFGYVVTDVSGCCVEEENVSEYFMILFEIVVDGLDVSVFELGEGYEMEFFVGCVW